MPEAEPLSPEFPDENCPQGNCDSLSCSPLPGVNDDGTGVQEFNDFMTFLAPPPRGPITAQAGLGELSSAASAATVAHAGQAKKARDRYAGLPAYKKTWLVAFLNSL